MIKPRYLQVIYHFEIHVIIDNSIPYWITCELWHLGGHFKLKIWPLWSHFYFWNHLAFDLPSPKVFKTDKKPRWYYYLLCISLKSQILTRLLLKTGYFSPKFMFLIDCYHGNSSILAQVWYYMTWLYCNGVGNLKYIHFRHSCWIFMSY